MGIVRIKEEEKKGKVVELGWNEEEKVMFTIKDISREEGIQILDASKNTGFKRGKSKDDIDHKKLGKILILKSVTGWKGVKQKHLAEIFDVKEFKFAPGTDANEDFPFSTENLRELSEIYSAEFMEFLTDAKKHISDILKSAREKDLKNL